MSDLKSVLEMIKENDVQFIDLRFTDPRGKWQHLAMDAKFMDEEMFEQ
jgi:glutamine synthetase